MDMLLQSETMEIFPTMWAKQALLLINQPMEKGHLCMGVLLFHSFNLLLRSIPMKKCKCHGTMRGEQILRTGGIRNHPQ